MDFHKRIKVALVVRTLVNLLKHTMASRPPPLTPDERLALEQKQKYDRLARNAAIGGVILCPIVALLPPRKLDLYTFALGFGFYFSADHLTTAYTGRGILEQWSFARVGSGLPTEKAVEMQRKLQEERRTQTLREGKEALKEGSESKGMLHKLWMGGETEGWKERRMEEERKALEEGKSYTSLILEQVWDVWNWDKNKGKTTETRNDKEDKS